MVDDENVDHENVDHDVDHGSGGGGDVWPLRPLWYPWQQLPQLESHRCNEKYSANMNIIKLGKYKYSQILQI